MRQLWTLSMSGVDLESDTFGVSEFRMRRNGTPVRCRHCSESRERAEHVRDQSLINAVVARSRPQAIPRACNSRPSWLRFCGVATHEKDRRASKRPSSTAWSILFADCCCCVLALARHLNTRKAGRWRAGVWSRVASVRLTPEHFECAPSPTTFSVHHGGEHRQTRDRTKNIASSMEQL